MGERGGEGRAHARSPWLALPPILLTFALASAIFAPQELGADGALAVGMALRPPMDALLFLRHDVHPPLFYLALRGWLDLAGHTFLDARWPSLACGALSVSLLYAIALRLFSRGFSAFAAAALFAVAPAFVSSSATVRDFAPGMSLSLASLLLTIRAIERPSLRRWLATMLMNAAALATWYFHPVFMLAATVFGLMRWPRLIPRLVAAYAGVLALISPWLVFSIPSLLAKLTSGQTFSGGQRTAPALPDLLSGFGNEALGHVPGWVHLGDPGPIVGVLWLAALAIGGVGMLSRGRASAATILAGGFGALALFWFARFAWVDTNNPGRYFLAAVPFASLAIGALASRQFGPVILGIGVLLGVNEYWRVHTLPPIPYEQDPILNQLHAVALPDDVAFFSDLDEYGRYELREAYPIPAYIIHLAGPPHVGDDIGPMIASTVPKLAGGLRIWFVSARPDAPAYNAMADTALEDAYFYVGQTAFPNNFLLREYANAAPIAPARQSQVLAEGVQLTAQSHTPTVKPGGVVAARLEWTAGAKLQQNFSAFLRLVAPNGSVIAQQDGWPRGGLAPTSTWQPGQVVDDRRALVVPGDAAPGSYRLVTGMYGDNGQPLGPASIEVGEVTVGG
ncbi:MAG: glycosyltransferase family 39 protein [Chloroflexi bacterium]|nr:glycosyltransferase family 39 protein [Chloroflexota bacterium]